jgi:hypothetical protein
MMWKKGAPGAPGKKWPRDSHAVGGRDADPVAEDGSKNGRRGLPEWWVEVWQKTLYIAVGLTLPPHLYLLLQ